MHRDLKAKVDTLLPKELADQVQGLLNAIDNDYQTFNKALEGVGSEAVCLELQKAKDSNYDLKRHLELVKATLESSEDGLLVVDLDGNPIVFNDSFIKMWGVKDGWMKSSKAKEIYEILRLQLKTPALFLALYGEVKDRPGASSRITYELKDARFIETYVVHLKDIGIIWRFGDISDKFSRFW